MALDASFLTSSSDSWAYCELSWLSKGLLPFTLCHLCRPSCSTTLLLSAGMALHWAESFSFSLHTNRESASWQHAVRHPDWRSHVAKTVTRVRQCERMCVRCVWSNIEKQPKKKKRKENKAKQRQRRETNWALTWASASATTIAINKPKVRQSGRVMWPTVRQLMHATGRATPTTTWTLWHNQNRPCSRCLQRQSGVWVHVSAAASLLPLPLGPPPLPAAIPTPIHTQAHRLHRRRPAPPPTAGCCGKPRRP